MLSSTALGAPRFSITSERRSSSTRRNSSPKLARALKAETTILLCVPVFIGNPSFQLPELDSCPTSQSSPEDCRLNRGGPSGAVRRLGAHALQSRSEHLVNQGIHFALVIQVHVLDSKALRNGHLSTSTITILQEIRASSSAVGPGSGRNEARVQFSSNFGW